MADQADDAALDDGEDHLDDAQAGKNTALRTRAQASDLGREQRMDKPAVQSLMARSRRGRDMTADATEQSKKVGGFAKRMATESRSERWYGKKED